MKQQKAKDYTNIWKQNPNGFGAASPDMLAHSHIEGKPISETSIIDIGAGNGRYALVFAKLGYKSVNALEISQDGVNLIREKAASLKNLQVAKADFLNHLPKQQYDIVFSSGLFEEFQSAAQQISALRKMQAMTKQGGKLVLRYCLFISNRQPEQRVEENLIKPLFEKAHWNVTTYETDDSPKYNAKSTIKDGQNLIQRQTLIAERL